MKYNKFVEVPWDQVEPQALRALIEEFRLRQRQDVTIDPVFSICFTIKIGSIQKQGL